MPLEHEELAQRLLTQCALLTGHGHPVIVNIGDTRKQLLCVIVFEPFSPLTMMSKHIREVIHSAQRSGVSVYRADPKTKDRVGEPIFTYSGCVTEVV